MSSFRLESGRSGRMEFERSQQICREGVYALLTPELNPLASDEDLGFLRDKTIIAENVERLEGDRADFKSAAHHLCRGLRDYKKLYGRDPGADQLAAIGTALRTSGGGSSEEIITEAARTVSKSSDFTARPQFMTLAALLPLRTISAQLGYSVGAVSADELTIHELVEQAGPNVRGVGQGELELNYQGELSSASIIEPASAKTDETNKTTFSAKLDYPIAKGRTRLVINKRTVAMDNGRGKFNAVGDGKVYDDSDDAVGLSDSSVHYSENKKVEIRAEFNESLNIGDSTDEKYVGDVWFEVQADVENHPEFISSIRFQTRSFTVYPSVNVIHTGFSLKAVLSALRNMRLNLEETALSRLSRRIADDIDRSVIRRLSAYSRQSVEPLLGYPPDGVSSVMDSWTAEFLGRLDYISSLVLKRAKGTAQIESWVGGGNFRRMALYAMASGIGRPAPPGEPASPGQPCYLGELEGQKLFFAPFLGDEEVIGTAGGDLPSRFPVIVGAAGPILPVYPDSGPDLSRHCSLCLDNFQDTTPDAYKYLEYFTIKTSDEAPADKPSLYDFAGRYSY